MKTFLRKLTDQELSRLTSLRDPRPLRDDSDIFCIEEILKEVPILVEGYITIMKNNEECLLVTPGYVIGLKQLLSDQPCQLKCRAKNARAVFASKKDFDRETDESFCGVIKRWFTPASEAMG
ncbi:MAG TPA: hypothetical protein VNJ01_07315 [Bacteriovoracaceae bacterium]|nr:hypothetical protein [Bacteriovoracaceae bacterium]